MSIKSSSSMLFGLCLIFLASGAGAQTDNASSVVERAPGRVCLSESGKPTDRCLRTSALSLRVGDIAADGRNTSDLVFRLAVEDVVELTRFAAASGDSNTLEICIVEGANICPPEPFEIIAVCITTSQLAGYECPTVPASAETGGVFVHLRSGSSTAQVGCVERATDWCRASHTVTGGPLSGLINCIVSATKQCVGAPIASEALKGAELRPEASAGFRF
ncbi:MAG: hypothetical protein AAGL24_05000 [Pseudomonadota bacterium]